MTRPFTPTAPPPVAAMAVGYFPTVMPDVPCATRLPRPSKTEDTINGFLRVESGGGPVLADNILYDCSLILHAYANNTDESKAEQLIGEALGWAGAAQGQILTHPSTGYEYYVTYTRITAVGMKHQDPMVNMVRYRGMVTWRLKGRTLANPSP